MKTTKVQEPLELKRYSPSWVDYIIKFIDRLRGRSWVYYSGFGVFLLLVQASISWFEGAFSVGKVHPVHIFLAAAIAFILAMMHHVNHKAEQALETTKPALTTNDEEYQNIKFRLTTHPALSMLLASIFAIAFTFFIEAIGSGPYRLEVFDNFPLSATTLRIFYLMCWWFYGALIYHSIHKLSLINRIYTRYTQINLFRMKPLYAFSNLAALTAGSLIVLPYGFLMVNEDVRLNDPVVFGVYSVFSLIAVVTFIWPQLGIHRLQNEEKERLLDEVNQRYEIATAKLHERVDGNNYEGMTNLSLAIGSLDQERKSIEHISTWPWQPETLRWLITALVLPLGLWIIQFFLQKMLAG